MTLWLLDTFPTWALGVIVVGAFVLWGVVGLWIVRRRWPGLAEGGQNELAGVVVGLVVGIYGIVLAFVIVALYERFDEARSSVREEATELAQLYRSSKAFPPDVRRIFQEDIRRYATVVVREEFVLGEGREHPQALRELDAMYGDLQRYSPEGPVEEAFYGSVINEMPELVAVRRQRLDYARESLPQVFQVLIFGGGFLLIGFLCRDGERARSYGDDRRDLDAAGAEHPDRRPARPPVRRRREDLPRAVPERGPGGVAAGRSLAPTAGRGRQTAM